jgi:FkbM family methyltransferase
MSKNQNRNMVYRDLYNKSNLKYNHNLVAPIIVDVGANIGDEAAKLYNVYPDSKVILVEPQQENILRIEEYIRVHGLESQWTIENCAIDLTPGTKQFGFHHFVPDDSRLNGSLDPFNWERWSYEGTKTVQTKTFDQICTTPNIVKIDIERYEYVVMPDICKNSNINIMYVELHGPCYELDILKFLDTCLAENGLEVTCWFDTENHEPKANIPCSTGHQILIERICQD